MAQTGTGPPEFTLFVNHPQRLVGELPPLPLAALRRSLRLPRDAAADAGPQERLTVLASLALHRRHRLRLRLAAVGPVGRAPRARRGHPHRWAPATSAPRTSTARSGPGSASSRCCSTSPRGRCRCGCCRSRGSPRPSPAAPSGAAWRRASRPWPATSGPSSPASRAARAWRPRSACCWRWPRPPSACSWRSSCVAVAVTRYISVGSSLGAVAFAATLGFTSPGGVRSPTFLLGVALALLVIAPAPRQLPPPAARRGAAFLVEGRQGRVSTVAVLGAGSWGTTLAIHLARSGAEVRLWGNVRADLDAMVRDRENRKFLPGIALPDGVKVLPELEAALDGADFVFYVVPSQAVREVAERVVRRRAPGPAGLRRQGTRARQPPAHERGAARVLGGRRPGDPDRPEPRRGGEPRHPDHDRGGRRRRGGARAVQLLCSTPAFRVYTNDDLVGVRVRRRAEERHRHRRRRLRRHRLRRQHEGRAAHARPGRDLPARRRAGRAARDLLRAGRPGRPGHDGDQPPQPQPARRRGHRPRPDARRRSWGTW